MTIVRRSRVFLIAMMIRNAKTIVLTYSFRMNTAELPSEMPKGAPMHTNAANAAINFAFRVSNSGRLLNKSGLAYAHATATMVMTNAGRIALSHGNCMWIRLIVNTISTTRDTRNGSPEIARIIRLARPVPVFLVALVEIATADNLLQVLR